MSSITPSFLKKTSLFFHRQRPTSIVSLLISLYTVAVIGITLLSAFNQIAWVNALSYSSNAVWQGQVLRMITYAFVNHPTIWFVLEMVMLFIFGREVERVLGSKRFGLFYLGLILLSPIVLQLLSLTGTSEQWSGSQIINFAIFTSFVALHPEVRFFFGLTGRWMLAIFVGLTSLQLIQEHALTELVLFLGESLAVILFMKAQGYSDLIPVLRKASFPFFLKRSVSSHSAPTSSLKSSPPKTEEVPSTLGSSTTTSFIPVFSKPNSLPKSKESRRPKTINIDALLDKISQTGMESLTEKEKEQLTNASTALLKRDGKE